MAPTPTAPIPTDAHASTQLAPVTAGCIAGLLVLLVVVCTWPLVRKCQRRQATRRKVIPLQQAMEAAKARHRGVSMHELSDPFKPPVTNLYNGPNDPLAGSISSASFSANSPFGSKVLPERGRTMRSDSSITSRSSSVSRAVSQTGRPLTPPPPLPTHHAQLKAHDYMEAYEPRLEKIPMVEHVVEIELGGRKSGRH